MMADYFKVLDVRVDELQANLNADTQPWLIVHLHYYRKGEERRATLVMVKVPPPSIELPPGLDPRLLRRN
jgi:hypothetical protein